MSPRSFTSVDDLQDGIDSYLAECKADDRPLTIAGLCVQLGICRETLSQYANGEYDDEENLYSDTLKNTKTIIEMNKNEGLLTGKYNPAGAIFDLKNNHGWKDRKETEEIVTHRFATMTDEELADYINKLSKE
jgi:hypothetical protein